MCPAIRCDWRGLGLRLAPDQLSKLAKSLKFLRRVAYVRVTINTIARFCLQRLLKRLALEFRYCGEGSMNGFAVHPLPVVSDAWHEVLVSPVQPTCSCVLPVMSPVQMPRQCGITFKQLIEPFECSLVFAVCLHIQLAVARVAAPRAVLVSFV